MTTSRLAARQRRLTRQEPFINQNLAYQALGMLTQLLRKLPSLVRPVHRYYGAVRLLQRVRDRRAAMCLHGPAFVNYRRRAGISRFSCMLFLSVRGFLDYAGPDSHSRLARLPCCLPPTRQGVGILIWRFSKLNHPAHRCLGLRFATHLAMCHARLEARMESLSPFLWGSCIPYNMPVYPGARRKMALPRS